MEVLERSPKVEKRPPVPAAAAGAPPGQAVEAALCPGEETPPDGDGFALKVWLAGRLAWTTSSAACGLAVAADNC